MPDWVATALPLGGHLPQDTQNHPPVSKEEGGPSFLFLEMEKVFSHLLPGKEYSVIWAVLAPPSSAQVVSQLQDTAVPFSPPPHLGLSVLIGSNQ